MHVEPYIRFKTKWDEVLKDDVLPRYLRSVVRVPFGEFRQSVYDASQGFVSEFVESIHSGDLWVVEAAFSIDKISDIKRRTLAFRASQPESKPKLVEGLQNYHQIVDGSTAPIGGYVAVDHSTYFFRWNGNTHGLFTILDDVWNLGKIVSGRSPDEYVANTPRDSFVDRVQVIQYPAGIGKITNHTDPSIAMKVNLGVFLSTYGVDFQAGGFFISHGLKQPVLLDPEIKAGDMVLWFPCLIHGVETIDPDKAIDWTSPGGRWYLALNTIESDFVKERHVARQAL